MKLFPMANGAEVAQVRSLGPILLAAWAATLGNCERSENDSYRSGDEPPIARALWYSVGKEDRSVEVFAGFSTDRDGPDSGMRYRWDWDSDGDWDTGWSREEVATHVFQESGWHRVTLEARDNAGFTSQDEVDVRVFSWADDAPVAIGRLDINFWTNWKLFRDVPSGAGFKDIYCSWQVGLAVRADGSLSVWGADDYEVVTGAPSGAGFVQANAGYRHGLALHEDGTIHVWGSGDSDGILSQAPTGNGFVQVASGWRACHALHADGSIVSWGSDEHGQVSGTPAGTGFIHVASGWSTSFALRADGSVVAWGEDLEGLIANAPGGTGFIKVAVALSGNAVALHTNGSLHAWGNDQYHFVSSTPTGTGFVDVAVDSSVGVAVRGNGNLVAWGLWGDPWEAQPSGSGFTRAAVGRTIILAY